MNNALIIVLLVMMFWFCLNQLFQITKKRHIIFYIVIYIILLYFVLFHRDRLDENKYSDGKYIIKWIHLIFTNKIIFINLIGNVVIFVPLGIFLKIFRIQFLKGCLFSLVFIIFIESLQYVTKRGIFDIIDIFLNMLGTIIGYMFIRKKRGIRNE